MGSKKNPKYIEPGDMLIRMGRREREGVNRRAASLGLTQHVYARRMLGLGDEIQENDPDEPDRPPAEAPDRPPQLKDFRKHPRTD